MDALTPFSVFSLAEIAAAINRIPNTYGRTGELGIFRPRPVSTNVVTIEEKNGSLGLLSTQPYGGPGSAGQVGKRKVRTFAVPQIVHNEGITPQEIQNLRSFGSVNAESLANLLNEKLTTARSKHDITREWLRMGALKGTILDGDGSTTLFNLFTEFGVAQITQDFVLGTSTTDVRGACMTVVRAIEDNLLGDTMSGVHALVSEEFFDKLVSHAKVKEAYANYQEASQRLGGDMRKGFTFGSITFEEYRGKATLTDGTTTGRMIAANDGIAYPEGTQQTFAEFAAPADFNEAVNTPGQFYYAKCIPAKFDRGYECHTQANVLPICMRPRVCVRIYSSN